MALSGIRYDITLPASRGLASAVVADLNNDGKEDLAIAQFNQPPQGSIQGFIATLLGNGDGTLQSSTSTPLSDIGIGALISADFSGDGNLDLGSAAVDANGGIAIFLGNGNGTFGSPVNSFLAGSLSTPLNPGPLAVGDFNGDGKMDLIVGSEDNGNNSSPLYLLTSKGDGTFTASFLYSLAYGFVPDVAVADFNHDSFLDLAVTTQNNLLIFLGRGDGTFQAPISYSNTNPFTNSVATGDFNSDGKTDVVVGTSGAILFYAGKGDGTFQAPVSTPTSLTIPTLAAADFNGDGSLDLATAGAGLSDSILIGKGDGTFQAPVPFEATYYPRAYTVGDLNGDGVVDLVQFSTSGILDTGLETATLWLSSPALSFTASSLQFPAQNVGTSTSTKAISLANNGNSALSLTGVAASGDFSETNTCAKILSIGDSCSIEVNFTPTANGPRTGSLTLRHNAKPGTQRLALSGWAGPPDFVPSSSPASVTVKAGSSAQYSLLLTSGDGFSGTVQVSCSGAPSGGDCQLSQNAVPLSTNGAARIQVTVTTTARASAFLSAPSFIIAKGGGYSTAVAVFGFSIGIMYALGWLMLPPKRRHSRVLATFAISVVLSGCGGGGGSSLTRPTPHVSGTPAGSYTLTLSTTSGSSSHTTALTLVVQ